MLVTPGSEVIVMKTLFKSLVALLAFTLAGVVYGLPANEYICKVQTVSVKLGAVWVQADSREIAAELASRAVAHTVEGKREPAQSTLECIQIPGETFQDKEFQRFVEGVPR
jgi:hypothetical protein